MTQITQIWTCIKCKTTTSTVATDKPYTEHYCCDCGELRVEST